MIELLNRWKKHIHNLKKIERENSLLKRNLSFLLQEKYPSLMASSHSRNFNSHEFNIYSQNGEDGLLLYILSKINPLHHSIIEFGASDGKQCNSANLLLNFGWKALLIEGNPEKVKSGKKYYSENGVDDSQLSYVSSFITRENINQLFTSNGFSGEIDILSIDIDGNDYHVWKSIDSVKPRLIICEYNAAFGPDKKITIPYQSDFTLKSKESSGFYFGASLALLEDLGSEKGYTLVGTDWAGVNAFFVRNDLLDTSLPKATSRDCYRENAKCKNAGGHLQAFSKISQMEFYTP